MAANNNEDLIINRLAKTVLNLFKSNLRAAATPTASTEESNTSESEIIEGNCAEKAGNSINYISLSSSDDEDTQPKTATTKENVEGATANNCENGDEEHFSGDNIEDDSLMDSQTSLVEDDNDSDVIDLVEDDQNVMEKLSGGPMICYRCYPSMSFRKKSLYLIHYFRHFADNHFVCPICRKGFVKLVYCVNHELATHKDTNLNDPGFSSALTVILNSSQKSHANINNSNNGKTDGDWPYKDYAIVSSSLYPYSGPPMENYITAYKMQHKFGRPKKNTINNLAKTVVTWKAQQDSYAKRIKEMDLRSQKKETTVVYKSSPGKSSNTDNGCVSSDRDSSYEKGAQKKKRKRYRKITTSKTSPLRAYCCTICGFKTESEVEFKSHKETRHPKLSDSEVLQYFELPFLKRLIPVARKLTDIQLPPRKKLRIEMNHDSSPDSSSNEDCNMYPSAPSSSTLSSEATNDTTSKAGFISALGLVPQMPK